MKTVWVVFTRNNARLIVNPASESVFEGNPNAFKNPDLSSVQGVPPHQWKLEGAQIVPMTPAEVELRHRDIEKNGVDNSLVIPFNPLTIWQKIIKYLKSIFSLR